MINVCDEIILLNQGEVLLKGNPKDVKNDSLAKKILLWRSKLRDLSCRIAPWLLKTWIQSLN